MQLTTLTIITCILAVTSNLAAQENESVLESTKSLTKEIQSEAQEQVEGSSAEAKSPKAIEGDFLETAPSPSDKISPAAKDSPSDEPRETPEEDLTNDDDLQAEESSEKEEMQLETSQEEKAKELEAFDKIVPVSVKVNEQGELIGKAMVRVNDMVQPVEAKVSIVKDGVLISRIYSNEDGSFSFPNVAPGQYDMYGSAASYACRQPVTVLSGNACCDCVNMRLSQQYSAPQYSTFSGAPAASLGSPVYGGFAGAPAGGFAGGGGGGFFSGGGAAIAGNPSLRLLGIGGIATAIAVGSSDGDASPSE